MSEGDGNRTRAWVLDDYGGPSDLRLHEVGQRTPGPNEVLVDVERAALGFADLLVCAGMYQMRPALPLCPGFEAAGTVTAVGAEVEGLSPGQRVLFTPDRNLGEGTMREQAVVGSAYVYPIPDTMDATTAAALFVTYQTTHLALHRRARLTAGQTVLVHAGAGGIGSAAIQLARAAGATVFATAGGPAKVEVCKALGADHVVDYTAEDFTTTVKGLTDGRGVDVIVDPVGGEVFEKSVRCVAAEGLVLVIGFAGGTPSTVQTNYLLVKNYGVMGVFYGPSPLQAQVNRETHEELMRLHADGKIAPLIFDEIAFADVPDGLERIGDRASYGKIVVRVRD